MGSHDDHWALLGSPQGHGFPNSLPHVMCFNPSRPLNSFNSVTNFLVFHQRASQSPLLCPQLHSFRPIVLAWQKEKLNELGSRMSPNGRTAQMQPFQALLCVWVRLRGIVLFRRVQESSYPERQPVGISPNLVSTEAVFPLCCSSGFWSLLMKRGTPVQ